MVAKSKGVLFASKIWTTIVKAVVSYNNTRALTSGIVKEFATRKTTFSRKYLKANSYLKQLQI
jgi:hypothetical protein